jgi:Mor family transcriptional regulator
MSYVKADYILPRELLELVQEYADGQYLYIPKKVGSRKEWGTNTNTRNEVKQRDREIYIKYMEGYSSSELACEYFLSVKSIQRILLQEKKSSGMTD